MSWSVAICDAYTRTNTAVQRVPPITCTATKLWLQPPPSPEAISFDALGALIRDIAQLSNIILTPPNEPVMKVHIKRWHAIAQWRWDTGADPASAYAQGAANASMDEDDSEGDVCGICRVAYEGCCPGCKMPGDDCPLIWGECTHVFHMHCLLKWIGTAASKSQCPMDRRPWVTAERKVARPNPS